CTLYISLAQQAVVQAKLAGGITGEVLQQLAVDGFRLGGPAIAQQQLAQKQAARPALIRRAGIQLLGELFGSGNVAGVTGFTCIAQPAVEIGIAQRPSPLLLLAGRQLDSLVQACSSLGI